jgi:hydrogenase maturation protein HypF
MTEIWRYQIKGIVQGVGFRPFIYRLASKYCLNGWVMNDSNGVVIEIEGSPESKMHFVKEVETNPPDLAMIETIRLLSNRKSSGSYASFTILDSAKRPEREALISPDTYVCSECLRELFDPNDRRYHYPFINCTNCGPRYSIIQDIPYDRKYTTMKVFKMCKACDEEYHDPMNRRFHAQPNACWECGPRVALVDREGTAIPGADPILRTIELLKEGAIVAVKGIGGYHLMVDPSNDAAVKELRRRKKRDEKPFALMCDSIEDIETIAILSEHETKLLLSKERPIVIVPKRPNGMIAEGVAPHNRNYGIMLAYTPLHFLILGGNFVSIVATSGNISDEPIAFQDGDAFGKLGGICDYFLTHNREIYMRLDDSIARDAAFDRGMKKSFMIRRARGYAPSPVRHDMELPSILAVGAELKNTVCVTKKENFFISQHIGDLKNDSVYRSFLHTIEHLKKIFEVTPEVIACDLHPDFYCTRYADRQERLPVVRVQHHHAHMASCMCENRLREPVIGVVFDGTGYGLDAKVWGGEFLVGDYRSFERRAHLGYFSLPGGDKAIKEPYRIAISLLCQVFDDGMMRDLPLDVVQNREGFELDVILKMIRRNINSQATSSMGRLFDAVSAILGIREVISYEGQAAIELEQYIDEGCDDLEPFEYALVATEGITTIDVRPMIREIADLSRSCPNAKSHLSGRFHKTVVMMVLDICSRLRSETGLNTVVLSGGVFMNHFLLSHCHQALTSSKFRVYLQSKVPANDGGISLGQAAVAAEHYSRGTPC